MWFEQYLFLTVLEAEKSKNKVPAELVSDEPSSGFIQSSSRCPHMAEEDRELSETLL